MGGKQTRRGQHLPLHIACVFGILLTVAGCAQFTRELQKNTPLARAQDWMDRGNFNSALIENDKVLVQPLSLLRDHALFQRGMIYSHPENPDRDYKQSIELFQEMIDQFPDSDLNHTAESFILLLHQLSDKERETKSLIRKLDQMKRELKDDERIMDRYRKALRSRKVKINRLNTQILELKDQIEKIKKIDLNIEKMKQNTGVR